jgi:flagellar M-ring protein FliF
VVSAWFGQHWAALTVAGLVIIGLMTLHSTVKSFSPTGVSADQTAAPAASPFSLVRDDEIERGHEPIRLDRPGRGATVPIHDELADIVRDDPDAAASILRTWIGNAS